MQTKRVAQIFIFFVFISSKDPSHGRSVSTYLLLSPLLSLRYPTTTAHTQTLQGRRFLLIVQRAFRSRGIDDAQRYWTFYCILTDTAGKLAQANLRMRVVPRIQFIVLLASALLLTTALSSSLHFPVCKCRMNYSMSFSAIHTILKCHLNLENSCVCKHQ